MTDTQPVDPNGTSGNMDGVSVDFLRHALATRPRHAIVTLDRMDDVWNPARAGEDVPTTTWTVRRAMTALVPFVGNPLTQRAVYVWNVADAGDGRQVAGPARLLIQDWAEVGYGR